MPEESMNQEELDDFELLYGRGPKHAKIIVLAKEAIAHRERIATLEARVRELEAAPGELEVWLCPPHRALDDARKLKPLGNCVACIRAQRDELEADNRRLRSIVDADSAEMERLRACALQAERERDAAQADNRRLRGLLSTALPKLGHPLECMSPNPTEDWATRGSWNTDNCKCLVAEIAAALQPSPVQPAAPIQRPHQQEPACDISGKCEARMGATGTTNCIHCGKELVQRADGNFYTWDAPEGGGLPQYQATAAPQLSGEAGEPKL